MSASLSLSLTVTSGTVLGGAGVGLVRSNVSHASGAFYFEMTVVAATTISGVGVGLDNGSESISGAGGNAAGVCWLGNGNVNYNGTAAAYKAAVFTVGSVLGVAVNLSSGLIWFRNQNGAWNNSSTANPATASGGFSIAAITPKAFAVAQLTNKGDEITANFAGPFSFTAPSGYGTF